jgi:two-component system, OmpR family, sensor kinase
MRFFHSIRWRLQLWHGVMLALVLVGFAVTSWRLERATRFQGVDQELERRVGAIVNAMRRGGGPPDRPPQDQRPARDRPLRQEPPPPERQGPEPGPDSAPSEIRLPEREAGVYDGRTEPAFYYVAWGPRGREIARSVMAPVDVPRPEPVAGSRQARLRGTIREYVHCTPQADCIVVGRDIGGELAGLRRFAWLLVAAGSTVFVLGLVGGWWISRRALQPIASISATAAKISTGDLAQRVPAADTGSELDDLAHVLNDTFDRLQASFVRQAQFTADASHELRTPVSVVLTETQAALAHERSAGEYRDSLATCQRAAQRMRHLIDSLLTLARLDSGGTTRARARCDVDLVARDVADLLRPVADRYAVTLTTALAPASCIANAEQIGQVVANLLNNAIYYNRAGGSVNVETASEPGAIVLSVSDTGQGIAPGDLPHIFERFYRADKARSTADGRCGLGLAITKAVVEAHGGTIRVASEPGEGTTFTVRLPAGDAQASDGPSSPRPL